MNWLNMHGNSKKNSIEVPYQFKFNWIKIAFKYEVSILYHLLKIWPDAEYLCAFSGWWTHSKIFCHSLFEFRPQSRMQITGKHVFVKKIVENVKIISVFGVSFFCSQRLAHKQKNTNKTKCKQCKTTNWISSNLFRIKIHMRTKRTHVSKRDTIYKSCNISYLFIAHLAHNI